MSFADFPPWLLPPLLLLLLFLLLVVLVREPSFRSPPSLLALLLPLFILSVSQVSAGLMRSSGIILGLDFLFLVQTCKGVRLYLPK